MTKWFIYALVDPREPKKIRYVGRTDDPIYRLKQHLYETRYPVEGRTNVAKFFFILYCLLDGVEPKLIILETVRKGRIPPMRERHWIKVHSSAELTNFQPPPPAPARAGDGRLFDDGEWRPNRAWHR